MSKEKVIICKVCKTKNQDRITVPKSLNSEYVAVKPLKIENIFDARRKYYR